MLLVSMHQLKHFRVFLFNKPCFLNSAVHLNKVYGKGRCGDVLISDLEMQNTAGDVKAFQGLNAQDIYLVHCMGFK